MFKKIALTEAMPTETAIIGWENIASIFGRRNDGNLVVSLRKIKAMRDEMIAAGVIFKIRVGRKKKTMWAVFPSDIKAFIRAKAAKGEKI